MKFNLKLRLAAVALVALGAFASCDSMKDNETPDDFVESVKDLSGVWQLESVVRNNIDISNSMDFSQFRLHLNSDGTYHLENYLPFLVKKDGKWDVDDPRMPFALILQEDGAERPVLVEITLPVGEDGRQIAITQSPGCPSNKYKYKFTKIN